MHLLIGLLSMAMSFWMIATAFAMTIFCYKKIEIIESYLNDCRCVSDARRMWGDGIIGRQMRMNTVAVALTFPRLMHHRGDISKDANLRVPLHLRNWIIWLYINLNALFVCMIGVYAFIKSR